MLTFFHSPQSRSTRVLSLIEEMGIADRIRLHPVTIPRRDGSGAPDPSNPHPERKVPALRDGDTLVTETSAVMLYLTARFPEAGLAPRPEAAEWGAYLTWMAWYGAVMEPVLILAAAGLSHDWTEAAWRGPAAAAARIRAALDRGPWLMGDRFTAADILVHSPYAFFPEAAPDDPLIRDWLARCLARPARLRALAIDEGLGRALAA